MKSETKTEPCGVPIGRYRRQNARCAKIKIGDVVFVDRRGADGAHVVTGRNSWFAMQSIIMIRLKQYHKQETQMKIDNSITHRIRQARAGIKRCGGMLDTSNFNLRELEEYSDHLWLELYGNQSSCELEHEEF